jgi:hypothetical protein
MNIRIVFFSLLISFFSNYGFGQIDTKPAESKFQSEITFEEPQFDFGSIKEGTTVSKEFYFKNTGDSLLIILNVLTTCGCTIVDWPRDPIKPGEMGMVKITYNSTGRPGRFNKVVTILFKSKKSPTRITISGIAEAQAESSPSTK